jgi:hypothetical protein
MRSALGKSAEEEEDFSMEKILFYRFLKSSELIK